MVFPFWYWFLADHIIDIDSLWKIMFIAQDKLSIVWSELFLFILAWVHLKHIKAQSIELIGNGTTGLCKII